MDAADIEDPARRASFLDRACHGDAELRAEVMRLLRQDAATELATATALPSPRPARTIAEGDTLAGRFRIVRFAGRGGMGEVYEAEDRELGGRVALKTLRPDLLDDPQFLARFRREVQIARQITHRNVCRIFDVGSDQGTGRNIVFLTMEFLDGETLQELLRRRGALPPGEALAIARQIADGLTALHASNVVHRDLKPANVILTRSDTGSPPRCDHRFRFGARPVQRFRFHSAEPKRPGDGHA